MMRIDIDPVNSKQREVINHAYDYIEFGTDFLVYSAKQTTREWEEDEEDNEIDRFIQTQMTETIINRSLHMKIKKHCFKGVWTYWSEPNGMWATTPLCDMTDEILLLFKTEEEARRVFDILDNWIFNT